MLLCTDAFLAYSTQLDLLPGDVCTHLCNDNDSISVYIKLSIIHELVLDKYIIIRNKNFNVTP